MQCHMNRNPYLNNHKREMLNMANDAENIVLLYFNRRLSHAIGTPYLRFFGNYLAEEWLASSYYVINFLTYVFQSYIWYPGFRLKSITTIRQPSMSLLPRLPWKKIQRTHQPYLPVTRDNITSDTPGWKTSIFIRDTASVLTHFLYESEFPFCNLYHLFLSSH